MKKSTIMIIVIVVLAIIIVVGGVMIGVYLHNQNNKKSETNTIYGVVAAQGNGYLTIDSEGNVYNINITEAYKPSEDIIIGDTVKITFNGDLKNNMSALTVSIINDVANTSIEESNNNTTNNEVANTATSTTNTTNTTNTQNTQSSTTKKDETEYYITGTVISYSESKISMKASNGYTYDVDISSASNDFAGKGVSAGETIRVVHYGKITGKLDTPIKALYVYKVQSVSSASEEHTIECTVKEATMNMLEVEYQGQTYYFSTATAKVSTSNGILNGITIKITYKGNLSKDNVAIKVED